MACSCPSKKRWYPTYRYAVRALLGSLRRAPSLRIYACPSGCGYHLTKKLKREAA